MKENLNIGDLTKSGRRIDNIRPAGKDHQVITVAGGKSGYMRKPCEKCPWRVDATGEFPAEAFKHSAPTAYDMSLHTFACHQSGADKGNACAGFMLRGAENNMSARVGLMAGRYDMKKISDGGHELHDSYRAMAVANGVDPDDPVLQQCRP